MKPTTLYRIFDSDGRLLYVGISANPGLRLTQHAGQSHWWIGASTGSFVRYPDRHSAELAELQAIANEHPVWNRALSNPAGLAFPRQLRLLPLPALNRAHRRPRKVRRADEPKWTLAGFIERLNSDEVTRRLTYEICSPETVAGLVEAGMRPVQVAV